MEQPKFFKMDTVPFSWKTKLFLAIIVITPFIVFFWVVLADDIINPKSSGEIFLNMREKIEQFIRDLGEVNIISKIMESRNI